MRPATIAASGNPAVRIPSRQNASVAGDISLMRRHLQRVRADRQHGILVGQPENAVDEELPVAGKAQTFSPWPFEHFLIGKIDKIADREDIASDDDQPRTARFLGSRGGINAVVGSVIDVAEHPAGIGIGLGIERHLRMLPVLRIDCRIALAQ